MIDYDRIYARKAPDEWERNDLKRISDTLKEKIHSLLSKMRVSAEVELVGSTSKGTNLKGGDIDLFIVFPTTYTRAEIVKTGLRIGHMILPDGQEKYAEHPYVFGYVEGHKIDVVPCFHMNENDDLKSAVDRSPLHTRWVNAHLDDRKRREIILLKAFMKGIGVYGSEVAKGGFSGYVCEILVIRLQSFLKVLEFFAGSEKKLRLTQDEPAPMDDAPILVTDPVDRKRNAAAAVTSENLARMRILSREFLHDPSESYFDGLPKMNPPRHPRKTCFRIFSLERPDLLDDIIYPQAEKLRRIIVNESRNEGFHPIDSEVLMGKRINILVELESDTRPAIKVHIGPPAFSPETRKFLDKWDKSPHARGPFIMDDRPVVEVEQASRYNEVLIGALEDKDIGAHLNGVKASIRIYSLPATKEQRELMQKYMTRNLTG
ncbi:MAG: CCA tRNA nucleotidyltransferase [Thermoplasmata archaeon]